MAYSLACYAFVVLLLVIAEAICLIQYFLNYSSTHTWDVRARKRRRRWMAWAVGCMLAIGACVVRMIWIHLTVPLNLQ